MIDRIQENMKVQKYLGFSNGMKLVIFRKDINILGINIEMDPLSKKPSEIDINPITEDSSNILLLVNL